MGSRRQRSLTVRELELTRIDGDPRGYALAGVGTLRFASWGRQRAEAQSGDGTWRLERSSWGRTATATDVLTGAEAARLRLSGWRRRGTLSSAGRTLDWSPRGLSGKAFELREDDRVVARLQAHGFSGRGLRVSHDEAAGLPDLVLLFACFQVRMQRREAAAAA